MKNTFNMLIINTMQIFTLSYFAGNDNFTIFAIPKNSGRIKQIGDRFTEKTKQQNPRCQ